MSILNEIGSLTFNPLNTKERQRTRRVTQHNLVQYSDTKQACKVHKLKNISHELTTHAQVITFARKFLPSCASTKTRQD